MENEATPKEIKKVLEGCINFLSIEVMAVDIPSSVLMSLEDHVEKMRSLVEKLGKMESFGKKTSPSNFTRARASSQKMNSELRAASYRVSEFLNSSSRDVKVMPSKESNQIKNTSDGIKAMSSKEPNNSNKTDGIKAISSKESNKIQDSSEGIKETTSAPSSAPVAAPAELPTVVPPPVEDSPPEIAQDEIYDDILQEAKPNALQEGTGDEVSICSSETPSTTNYDDEKLKALMLCSKEEMKAKAIYSGTIRKHKQSFLTFKWDKRFCALVEDTMFYYKPNVDQKPLGRIHLPSYKLVIPQNDKGFIFNLESIEKGQSTYMFQSDSLSEASNWKKYLATVAYRDGGVDNVSLIPEYNSSSGSDGSIIKEEIYDDIDSSQQQQQVLTSQQQQKPQSPLPLEQNQMLYEVTNEVENQDIYDDVNDSMKQQQQQQQQATTPVVVAIKDENIPPLPMHHRAPLPPPSSDATPIPPRPPMPPPSETSPILSRPPLSPPPSDATSIPPRPPTGQKVPAFAPPIPVDQGFSIDNIYMGMYDCEAEDDQDLAFERGDIMYILERVDVNWWIGFLEGKGVGLVPSNHLTTAFVN